MMVITRSLLCEDISIGVFRRLTVLDGIVELVEETEPIEINGLPRGQESAFSAQTWPPKAGGQSPK